MIQQLNVSKAGNHNQSPLNGNLVQPSSSKKERLEIDRLMHIQRGNHLMLRKLIEIDHGKSELNKRKLEPLIFKARRSLNRRKIQ
jgi:hypothetical protein